MPLEITLNASTRQNLLALQNTSTLLSRTQGRLSTGLKVASPIDDAVAFFQAKALTERAADLSAKKSDIDQGISTIKTALTGVESTDTIVKQIKGLVTNSKAATASERTTLATQINGLFSQINFLSDDASYQGLNLINSTASTLNVSFSEKTTSKLSVTGTDTHASVYFTASLAIATATLTTLLSAGGLSTGAGLSDATVTQLDFVIAELDFVITKLRANAKALGANVALLQTRLDFTSTYVINLQEGGTKFTGADLNEEGANLVALQTRQQLSLQALAFAGQAEQSILQLFR